jgi:hypothetical protein
MFRIDIVSGIALFAVSAVNAGQIQIGSGVNGVNGLTSTAVTGAGCSPGGPCTEKGYVPVLFQNAPAGPSAGTTFVDSAGDGGSGVTFARINDGAGNNFWALPTGSAASTLTVPVGVFGVTDAWTMINDIESNEVATARDINVTFNFGTNANGIGGTNFSDLVKLKNSNAVNANGQVRDALVCTGLCNQSSQVSLGGEVSGGVTVVADNVFNSSFTVLCQNPLGVASSVVPNSSCGEQGTTYLDDQGFFFNSLNLDATHTNLNTFLVSIQVSEVAGSGGGAGLSAITVDTSAAPEPSTVFLFVAGLGVVGLGRFRKRA